MDRTTSRSTNAITATYSRSVWSSSGCRDGIHVTCMIYEHVSWVGYVLYRSCTDLAQILHSMTNIRRLGSRWSRVRAVQCMKTLTFSISVKNKGMPGDGGATRVPAVRYVQVRIFDVSETFDTSMAWGPPRGCRRCSARDGQFSARQGTRPSVALVVSPCFSLYLRRKTGLKRSASRDHESRQPNYQHIILRIIPTQHILGAMQAQIRRPFLTCRSVLDTRVSKSHSEAIPFVNKLWTPAWTG